MQGRQLSSLHTHNLISSNERSQQAGYCDPAQPVQATTDQSLKKKSLRLVEKKSLESLGKKSLGLSEQSTNYTQTVYSDQQLSLPNGCKLSLGVKLCVGRFTVQTLVEVVSGSAQECSTVQGVKIGLKTISNPLNTPNSVSSRSISSRIVSMGKLV